MSLVSYALLGVVLVVTARFLYVLSGTHRRTCIRKSAQFLGKTLVSDVLSTTMRRADAWKLAGLATKALRTS